MGLAALAEVMDGWTGSITVTVGASSVVVVPGTRESVASLWTRVQMRARAELGLGLVVTLTAEDQSQADADAVFDMVLAGNCATRTDFDAGPYSGAASYLSDGNTPDGLILPSKGLRLADPMLGSAGRAAADGTDAAVLMQTAVTSTLRLFTTIQAAAALEAAIAAWTQGQQVHDVWHDGRVIARVRIDGMPVRRPLTRTHGLSTSGAEIAVTVTGCAL